MKIAIPGIDNYFAVFGGRVTVTVSVRVRALVGWVTVAVLVGARVLSGGVLVTVGAVVRVRVG